MTATLESHTSLSVCQKSPEFGDFTPQKPGFFLKNGSFLGLTRKKGRFFAVFQRFLGVDALTPGSTRRSIVAIPARKTAAF